MKNINERNNFVFEFRPVTELFEEQVKLHPEKCAVVSGKESFTYAQLNERANRIANALVEKGVRRETIVGVVLERCCDFYAVRQGILKAGGAFAVATPDYPDDRIRYIFEDSGAPFIITTKEIAEERRELFAKLPCTVLLIEELLENENTENPQVKIGDLYFWFHRQAQGCADRTYQPCQFCKSGSEKCGNLWLCQQGIGFSFHGSHDL